jgi:hypothetical protein
MTLVKKHLLTGIKPAFVAALKYGSKPSFERSIDEFLIVYQAIYNSLALL